jgi:hypothetical protein
MRKGNFFFICVRILLGPKHFTEGTTTALEKTPEATKYSDYRTFSLIARAAKIVARILRRFEREIEDVLVEDQFGFRRRKGTSDAVGVLRISEPTVEID